MPTKMMKAVRLHEFGGPEVLRYEDAPIPELTPGEVLVRVHAVGINPPDLYLREGYKMLPPEWQPKVAFPVILGTDISGAIEAVADDVTGFSAGDEVYSMVRFPSGLAGGSRVYAEYVSVPASEVALKPAGIDHAHAAGAPMSLLTAWQYMIELGHNEQNPLQPNRHEPCLLRARLFSSTEPRAAWGISTVQLAKRKGARVIAVASGKNEEFLRGLGADEFIDYTKIKPEDAVRDVDLVIDAVGGPTTGRFLRTLKRGGALFPIFPLGFSGAAEAEKLGVTVSATQVRSNGSQLAEIGRLLDAGTVRVAIDSTLSARRCTQGARAGRAWAHPGQARPHG